MKYSWVADTNNYGNPPPPFGHPLPFSRFELQDSGKREGEKRKENPSPLFCSEKRGARGVAKVACISFLLEGILK